MSMSAIFFLKKIWNKLFKRKKGIFNFRYYRRIIGLIPNAMYSKMRISNFKLLQSFGFVRSRAAEDTLPKIKN